MTDTICLIDAPRFASARQQGHVRFLIDVRSPAEFRAQHVAGARNVPLDQLNPAALVQRLRQEGLQRGDELYLLCHSGQRARRAADQLQQLLPGVQVIDGGTQACVACGLPTEEAPSGVISIQRQANLASQDPQGSGNAQMSGANIGFIVAGVLFWCLYLGSIATLLILGAPA